MEWKPDKQYPDDQFAGDDYYDEVRHRAELEELESREQEPPETHPIKNSIRGALYLSIMILMVIGVIWVALLAGVGK